MGSNSNFNYYADCPVVSVMIWEYQARSSACPTCAAMDGEVYVTFPNDDEPHEEKQHRHCHCKWHKERESGLLESSIEELKNRHADVKKELDDAEAEVEFRRLDMVAYRAEAEKYEQEEAEQKTLAESLNNQAQELINSAQEILDSYSDEDEIPEDVRDWIDEQLLNAESLLARAQEASDAAEQAHEDMAEALRNASWHEDEMDAAIKRAIIWKEEMMKLEPCLEWKSIQDIVHEVAGAGAHFMI